MAETSVRTIIAFLIFLILIRLVGKKQLNQITFFTYITGIALGSISGDMILHRDVKMTDAVVSLILWSGLTVLIEWISLRNKRIRSLLDGEPTIVIRNGVLLKEALASTRLNIDNITMLLRLQNVFSISEVDYALLEPNGQLSVLKKIPYDLVTKKDMNIHDKNRQYVPTKLILEGEVIQKNLDELQIDREWLLTEIAKKGYTSPEEIFFATIESDGEIHISEVEE